MIKFISLFISLVFLFSCTEGNESSEVKKRPKHLLDVTIDFHENGKPKSQELFELVAGEKVIYGFQELYPSGEIKILGTYNLQKQREGLWSSFYENGKKWSVGNFEGGVANGVSKVWYENGSMRYEGEMKDGKPTGTWMYWDEKGIESKKKY